MCSIVYSYLYTCAAPFGADGLVNKINLFNSTGVTESYIANISITGGCAHEGEFECLSGHCIDRHLACDGHLHCDSGHDEGIACKRKVPYIIDNESLSQSSIKTIHERRNGIKSLLVCLSEYLHLCSQTMPASCVLI